MSREPYPGHLDIITGKAKSKGFFLEAEEMIFADQIKTARLAAGLTQAALAEVTGIPNRTIQDWEAGKRTPPEWTQRLVLKELAGLSKDTVK